MERSWWQKLKSNPLARFAAIVLAIFYITVIFADFFAPYNPLAQQPNGSLLPPSQIYWRSIETGDFIGPHVYPTIQGPIDLDTGIQELEVDYSRPAPLKLFVRGEDYRLFELVLPIITSFSFDGELTLRELRVFDGIPSNWHLYGAEAQIVEAGDDETLEAVETAAAYINILGTDNAARDVFSRLAHGGRISLSIGLIGIAISFPLGLLVGGISGYFGGIVDSVLMRIVEVIMTIPSHLLIGCTRCHFAATAHQL